MNYKNAYEEMKRLYEILQQENQSLKDRVEKAIDYIINNFDFDNDVETLFEILKGDK